MEKIVCEYCEKVIEGFTKGQTDHNLDVHKLSKHKEELKKLILDNWDTIPDVEKNMLKSIGVEK